MQSQEEKLNLFLKAINDYAEEQRLRILSEMDEQSTTELSRAEKEALSDAYRLIQRETSDVRNSVAQELASRELEGKRRLFEQRAQIEQEVFKRAEKQLISFADSIKYPSYLEKAARSAAAAFAAKASSTVFRLREADMKHRDVIASAFGAPCEFAVDPQIHIGGLLAVNSALGVALDATLDGRLDSQHEWFGENAHLPLV